MEKVIEIKRMSAFYNSHCVLRDIDLTVERGEFLAIIGPNGGGKTTLAKILLGMKRPGKGRVRILGRTPEAAKGSIGYVPQFTSFEKDFPVTVGEVAAMGLLKGLKPFRRYAPGERRRVSALLERTGLENLADRPVARLSGGQIQKMLLARALVSEPEILLLDEPTASVDLEAKNQIYSLLKELNRRMTILLITHDIGVVSTHVKSIACLNVTLHYHGQAEIDSNIIEHLFGCPVDLVAHGVPHRVLKPHEQGGESQ